MWKKIFVLSLIALTVTSAFLVTGCGRKQEIKLLVYAGNGLMAPMQEIKHAFEQRHPVKVTLIYTEGMKAVDSIAGTKKGDVFIPGCIYYIEKAGDLVANHRYVALHTPVAAVRKDNPKKIQSVSDMARPGTRIAMGAESNCANCLTSGKILAGSDHEEEIKQNVVMTGAHATELINLVLTGEVDVSIIWSNMLQWPEAADLQRIDLPDLFAKSREIHVAVLTTAADSVNASLFADFVAMEGRDIFRKHGFVEKL